MPSTSLARLGSAFFALALFASAAGAQCGIGDFDGNGEVDGADLGVLLAAWGGKGEADLDDSGAIDGADLGILLASWGPIKLQTGAFPEMWINGGPNCPSAGGDEPQIQVHWYNDDMAILRQSLCTNFEAPFMTLLFGSEKVLMMDTGAGGIPIAQTVQSLIAQWLAARGQESIQLVVAHTHGHGDHVAGNSQFQGLPDTVVVGNSQAAVIAFFGIDHWPQQIVEYDLGGGRVVDIIPIPGHQSAHIAFYDRRTGILFTGDTLYPGRLYISSFTQYLESIDRLVEFTSDKPLCWILGTHIEMSTTPGVDFPLGSTSHPNEHALQLTRSHLLELQAGVHGMQGNPHIEVHDDFIIFPLGGADAPAAGEGEAQASVGADGAPCRERPHSALDLKRLMRR